MKDACQPQPNLENPVDWDKFFDNIRVLSKTNVFQFSEDTSDGKVLSLYYQSEVLPSLKQYLFTFLFCF